MKRVLLSLVCLASMFSATAQTNPAILSWLQNNSVLGRYYVQGNSTAMSNNILANVQTVQYSANWVYVSTKGIPTYPTGPFLDGNPSQASNQNAIFKISLNPVQNTGTATATTGGNIGIFINGVALFDYRDGVSWKNATNALAGGPSGGMGDGVWNRDAIPAERAGFDCAKGHPAMGNYHHHQNPSAFKLDKTVISTVCNLYDSDGLYVIDSAQHSPLLGFAYDGFPIYGAYGYTNTNGTGSITRMKSSYLLRNITVRTHYADGTDVTDGPAVSTTYPLGYFREDYEFVANAGTDYLDSHNGRFCVTPEYPNGIYAYFCTVDANWNSAYPYAVGPTFYGVKNAVKVASITETVTTYTPAAASLATTPDTVNIPATANSSGSFTITANIGWTATSSQSWLTLSSGSGSNNGTITLTAQANTATTPRTATVTVAGTGVASRTVTVIQAAAALYLSGAPDTVYIAAPANSSGSLIISSNTSWTASSNQGWLMLNNSTGTGDATITLTAQANTASTPRTALVTLTGTGVANYTVTVIQVDSLTLFLSASPDSIIIPASANTSGVINIAANTAWTATSSEAWLTLGANSGSSNGAVTLIAQANVANTSRTAIVTISGTGVANKTIFVTQLDSVTVGITTIEEDYRIAVYPSPANDILAIQFDGLVREDISVRMFDMSGKLIQETAIFQGSTIAFLDVSTVYSGMYILHISNGSFKTIKKVVVER